MRYINRLFLLTFTYLHYRGFEFTETYAYLT